MSLPRLDLVLSRYSLEPTKTRGELFVNYEPFAFTIEDAVRAKKIPKITAIPDGVYRVVLTKSPRFGGRILPLLIAVPNFDGIRIHGANDENDLEGCIGIGRNKTARGISDCAAVLNKLITIIRNHNGPDDKRGETWITVDSSMMVRAVPDAVGIQSGGRADREMPALPDDDEDDR